MDRYCIPCAEVERRRLAILDFQVHPLTFTNISILLKQIAPKFHLKKLKYYFVYILKCADNKSYTGYTQNLKARLRRHHKGYVKSTKKRRPLLLITYIAFSDKWSAITYEKYLKSGSGRATLYKRYWVH